MVVGGGTAGLALGALGVVFGDIGTSPLYAMETVFSIDGGAVAPTPTDVLGVVSLIFWSLTLIVAVKYVTFVLRADNDGEGGIMALAALVQRVLEPTTRRRAAAALMLGVVGAALFYGDSLITPAISVLSAVEGLEVADPRLAGVVLPLGVVILTALFVIQRRGTGAVARLFGPVMLLWFATLAVLGLPHVLARPEVLRGLSPTYAVAFVADRPAVAFVAMGAVVLVVTGAEALYADLGQFGRRPVRVAWFAVAFPGLVLNYLGQAALILADPRAISDPFYLLAPAWARLPLVVLATCATVIAAQAVISGAFSMTRQSVHLGCLPRLTVRHTSTRESGQVYLPAVNWTLFAGVLVLILAFRSSERLATAYGLAVTGTLLLTTTLFLTYAATAWRWPRWKLVLFAVVLGGLELTYFGANLTKIVHGGWLPLLVALVVVTVMTTWQQGRRLVAARHAALEGSLDGFVDRLHAARPTRVAGTAVVPHPGGRTAPLALAANLRFNHVVHRHVVIVAVGTEKVPHVPPAGRVTVERLGATDDHLLRLEVRFGFRDEQDVPAVLRHTAAAHPGLIDDPAGAVYLLSHLAVESGGRTGMRRWRKRLFLDLARTATSPAEYFRLPPDRTLVVGSRIEI